MRPQRFSTYLNGMPLAMILGEHEDVLPVPLQAVTRNELDKHASLCFEVGLVRQQLDSIRQLQASMWPQPTLRRPFSSPSASHRPAACTVEPASAHRRSQSWCFAAPGWPCLCSYAYTTISEVGSRFALTGADSHPVQSLIFIAFTRQITIMKDLIVRIALQIAAFRVLQQLK